MNIVKSCSRRCLWWTFLIMLILALTADIAGVWAWRLISAAFPARLLEETAAQSASFKAGLDQLMPLADFVRQYYIPVVSILFVLFWLLQWGILRAAIAGCLRSFDAGRQPAAASPKKDKKTSDADAAPMVDKKEMMETNKRFYLHLLTVLQRDGRLLDFFAEDLSAYEDAQIGAAVRSIQESCKSTLKKQLHPKAIMDQNEGDEIVVPLGFDPNAVTLTGNVSGEPPFRGVLRHKGWRASRLELPTLSPARDSQIIAPAEVEIM